MIEGIIALDHKIFLLLNSLCSSLPADIVLGLWNQLGNGWAAAALIIPIVLIYDRTHGKRRIVALAISVAVAGIAVNVAKPIALRSRPISLFKEILHTPEGHDVPVIAPWFPWEKKSYPIDADAQKEYFWTGDAIHRFGAGLGRSSFPSGHAATVCGVFFGLWFIYRRRPISCFILASGACVGRVYVGAHFPSDVLIGALSGTTITWGMLEITKPFWLGKKPAREGPLVAVSVGEASADAYAAQFVERLKARHPDLQVTGMGGPGLVKAGMDRLVDANDLSIVGFTQVLMGAARIRSAFWRLVRKLDAERPDLLLLIDLPDFNLMLAKQAKRLGIRVLYFIPPQVWAWRKGRVKKIARRTDALAVIFPMEEELYRDLSKNVRFVGHPLVDRVRPSLSKEEFFQRHELDESKRLVAILPGSRTSEIEYIIEPMLQACGLLNDRFADLQFALSRANSIDPDLLRRHLTDSRLEARLIDGDTYDLLSYAEVGLITSGTATLEAALCGLPMVVCYRGGTINYRLAKGLVAIDRIGLPNIVSDRKDLAVELIQEELTPERLAEEAGRFLADAGLAGQRRRELLTLRESLRGGDVIGTVAHIASDMIEG